MFTDPSAGVAERELQPGDVLIRQGTPSEGLFLVESGEFDVTVGRHDTALPVGTVGPGAVLGEISLFAGGRPTASVTARTPARVRFVSHEIARDLLGTDGGLADDLADEARRRVNQNELATLVADLAETTDPGVIRDMLDAAEIVDLRAGSRLFDVGDPSDAAYLVISGRLAATRPDDEQEIARFGRGQVIGEGGFFAGGARGSRVVAIRDSVLARIAGTAFETLLSRHPRVMVGVARQIVGRMMSPRHQRHVTSSIAVAVTAPTNARVLTTRLLDALRPYGQVGHLTSGGVDAELDRPGISQAEHNTVGAPRLSSFLHEYELSHDLMVLEMGRGDRDPWVRRATGIADRVMLVVSPNPGEDEVAEVRRIVDLTPPTTTIVAVVHHPVDTQRPHGSAALAERLGVDEILHVRAGSVDDMGRVARLATSRAVGLVLGGGGARGFAHIGAVRALVDLGVPIDMVVGASIGAPLAGGVAIGFQPEEFVPRATRLFANLLDYTVPVVSLIKAERITASIDEAFDGWDFEDTWIPYRCVSTNLTRSRTDVHRTGPISPRVRASVAIPGVMPPVPDGDDLLVDGGVLNNLPVDVVAREGRCSTIIAVDVAPPLGPRAKADYGLSVSGWEALRASFGRSRSSFPGITAILLRSMLVGSMRDRNRLIDEAPVDLHMQLDLRGVGLLEFDTVEPVAEQGYELARPLIEAWLDEQGGWR